MPFPCLAFIAAIGGKGLISVNHISSGRSYKLASLAFRCLMIALQYVVFAIISVGLYLLSDYLLRRIEQAAGRRLPERSLIFMGILMIGLLVAFWLIRQLLPA